MCHPTLTGLPTEAGTGHPLLRCLTSWAASGPHASGMKNINQGHTVTSSVTPRAGLQTSLQTLSDRRNPRHSVAVQMSVELHSTLLTRPWPGPRKPGPAAHLLGAESALPQQLLAPLGSLSHLDKCDEPPESTLSFQSTHNPGRPHFVAAQNRSLGNNGLAWVPQSKAEPRPEPSFLPPCLGARPASHPQRSPLYPIAASNTQRITSLFCNTVFPGIFHRRTWAILPL